MQPIAWMDHYDPETVHLGNLRSEKLKVCKENNVNRLVNEKLIDHYCSLHIDNAHDLLGEHIVEAVKEAGPGKLVYLTDFEVYVLQESAI